MNSQYYCEQKILREGSCLYYSLRFIKPQTRYVLLLLHTLYHEIEEIKYKCQDSRVAIQKYQWWQQEIQNLIVGKPTHPITQGLFSIADQCPFELSELEIMVKHLTQYSPHFIDFEQLETYCRQTSGQLQVLTCKVLGYQKDNTVEAIYLLGILFQLYYFLRELRRDALNGHIYIPQSELAQFNLTQHAFFEQEKQVLQPLLQFQVQRIHQYYNAFLETLPKTARRSQKMGLIRSKLIIATLSEMERDNLAIFEHKVSLTPMRKLWITMSYLW